MLLSSSAGRSSDNANPATMAAAFEKHLREVYSWLDGKPYVKSIRVAYHEVLKQPEEVSRNIADFLGIPLGLDAMTQQVDKSLYRNRSM